MRSRTIKKNCFDYVRTIERPALCLYYENLLKNEQECVQSVFNFLDVPNHQVTGKTRKNTNDDLRQVIENFSDLCEYYRGTRYADMFVELQLISTKHDRRIVRRDAKSAE